MAIDINFVLDQGTLFDAIATIKTESGTIFDLTGLAVNAQMRRSHYATNFITIRAEVIGDPLDGNIKLALLPTETNGINTGRYVYDVEVRDLSGEYVKRVLQGVITVSPQVTILTGDVVAAPVGSTDVTPYVPPVSLSTINNNPQPVYTDASRDDQVLSTSTITFVFTAIDVSNGTWFNVGEIGNYTVGHIMPFDGMIIGATLWCKDDTGNQCGVDLYVNNDMVLRSTSLVTAGLGNGDVENTLYDNEMSVLFVAGDKIRVRGYEVDVGDTIEDTLVNIFVKWRKV